MEASSRPTKKISVLTGIRTVRANRGETACMGLLSGPARGALAQEGGDALLSVGRQGVHRHDFLGIGVSLGLVEIDLRVEGLLADGDHERAGFGNFRREFAGGGGE